MDVAGPEATPDTWSREPTSISAAHPVPSPVAASPRPTVRGKFIEVGGERLFVRGITYGPLGTADGYPDLDRASTDLARIRAAGANAIRVYTVPPVWFLGVAHRLGLWVMVGLNWPHHRTFLADGATGDGIEAEVRRQIRTVAGHPAVLCYVLGNEIPSPIVRWHGPAAVERFLDRLCRAGRAEDPGGLFTYANYPSTQYLRTPFLDLISFNVYLEGRPELSRYLAGLQHEAEEQPLLLTELGLDSLKHGDDGQADALRWQIAEAFAGGCCGTFVFGWTDDWRRGGVDVEGWAFGLTRRDGTPKPALSAVADAYAGVPFPSDAEWPRATVIVCTHNGARTLAECLAACADLQYADVEIVVVDDGSTDESPFIVGAIDGVRLVRLRRNGGLSAARNAGLRAATGSVIAYLDDDARPDPMWLHYIVDALRISDHAGVGGPNLLCPEDGLVAACVDRSPGGPVHVMLTERVAEHIPGCNMAFRRSALLAIGGFDPRFWIAGDDVDVCWRLQEYGMTLGFAPAAVVWHHRRGTVGGYWRQQVNYGRAEAELERKWPHKYNALGHPTWDGRLYGRAPGTAAADGRRQVFYGTWGTALFQTPHLQRAGLIRNLPNLPEWYMGLVVVGAAAITASCWSPLAAARPAMLSTAAAMGLVVAVATLTGFARHWAAFGSAGARCPVAAAALTTLLCRLQPIARLWGRTSGGLTPWRWANAPLATRRRGRRRGPLSTFLGHLFSPLGLIATLFRPARLIRLRPPYLTYWTDRQQPPHQTAHGTLGPAAGPGPGRAVRRADRPVGPGGPRRTRRCRPHLDGRRGSRPRPTPRPHPRLPLVAPAAGPADAATGHGRPRRPAPAPPLVGGRPAGARRSGVAPTAGRRHRGGRRDRRRHQPTRAWPSSERAGGTRLGSSANSRR